MEHLDDKHSPHQKRVLNPMLLGLIVGLLFSLVGCSAEKPKAPTNPTKTVLQASTGTRCDASSPCSEGCFEPEDGSCEGRWAYPKTESCYALAQHPECGLVVSAPPNAEVGCHMSSGYGLDVIYCDTNESTLTTIVNGEEVEVETNLPSDYMRFLYGSGASAVIADVETPLLQLCGQDAVDEFSKIPDQCFPLASDIGSPDDIWANFLEIAEVWIHIFQTLQTCRGVSDPTNLGIIKQIVEKLPIDSDGVPYCAQTPGELGSELSNHMKGLGCSAASIDQLVDSLFVIFYGRVKDKVEDVVVTHCPLDAQEDVYVEILNAIESAGGDEIETALTNELERQCRQACYEMSYYWDCDAQERVCPDGSGNCDASELQCPADPGISEKVIISQANCDSSQIIEETIETEGNTASGARAQATCEIVLRAPSAFGSTEVTARTCRTAANGEDPDPENNCGESDFVREYVYTDNGISYQVAYETLPSSIDVDPKKLVCLTEDTMLDWGNKTPTASDVELLRSRLMSLPERHSDAFRGLEGEVLETVWLKRLKVLGELHGDLLFEPPSTGSETGRRVALDDYYTNLSWLYERYPDAQVSCYTGFTDPETMPFTTDACGHDAPSVDAVELYGFAPGLQYAKSINGEHKQLVDGATVGSDLVVTDVPFGMKGLHYVRSQNCSSCPVSPLPADDSAFLSFTISSIDPSPGVANDATVSVVFDASGEDLTAWLRANDWRIEPGLKVEVQHHIKHVSPSPKRDYIVASKDFRAGDVVVVPGHHWGNDGGGANPAWPYFVTVHPTDLGARVDMCERYLGRTSAAMMEGQAPSPMVEACAKRLSSGANHYSNTYSQCLDFVTRKAIQLPPMLLDADITPRSLIEVEPNSAGIQEISFPAIERDRIQKTLAIASRWEENLRPAVDELFLNPVKQAVDDPTTTVDETTLDAEHISRQTVNDGISGFTGVLHAGLGTHTPISIITPTGDDDTELKMALRERYTLNTTNNPPTDDDLLMGLKQWRQETHRVMVEDAHEGEDISELVLAQVAAEGLELIAAQLDAGRTLHDSVCQLSDNCGFPMLLWDDPSQDGPPVESSMSALWGMLHTFLAEAPADTFWDASTSLSPLSPGHVVSNDYKHQQLELLLESLDTANSAGLTVRDRLRTHTLQTGGLSQASDLGTLDISGELALTNAGLDRLHSPLSTAAARRLSFETNGTLSDAIVTVRTRMNHANIQAQTSAGVSAVDNLGAQLASRYNSLIAIEQDNISNFDNNQQLDIFDNQFDDLVDEFDKVRGERAALRQIFESPGERLETRVTELEELSNNTDFTKRFGDTYISTDSFITNISAEEDSRFTGLDISPNDSIAGIAVPWGQDGSGQDVTSLQVDANSLVTIQVEGQWAPDCALRMNQHLAFQLTGEVLFGGVWPAPVSSSGYAVVYSNSAYVADDAAVNATAQASLSKCTDISTSTGSPAKDLVGTGASINTQAQGCVVLQASTTASTSVGRRTSSSAAYESGYRVSEGVPFPEAPAGSLLLVGVKLDAQGNAKRENIKFAQVVHGPRIAKIVPDDLSLFLVINDQAHDYDGSYWALKQVKKNRLRYPKCLVDEGAGEVVRTPQDFLTVSTNVSAPATTLMEMMGNNMALVLEDIQAERDSVVNSGVLFSTTIQRIRSDAFARYYKNSGGSNTYGGNYSDVPEALRTVFESWIDAELDALQIELAISQKDRQLEVIKRDVLRIIADLVANRSTRGDHLARAAALSQQRAQMHELGKEVDVIKSFMFEYVLPLLLVKQDPQGALAVLDQNKLKSLLDESLNLDRDEVTSLFFDLFSSTSPFATQLATMGQANNKPPVDAWVAVSFPRPDLRDAYFSLKEQYEQAIDNNDTVAQQQLLADMSNVGLTEEISWVVDHRTDGLWAHLLDTKIDSTLEIEVIPEDLYPGFLPSPTYQPLSYTLLCSEVEPVVLDTIFPFNVDRSSASLSLYPNISTEGYEQRIDLKTEQTMNFVNRESLVPVNFFDTSEDEDQLSDASYIGYIDGYNALNAVKQDGIQGTNGYIAKGSGEGLTPFRTIIIPEASLYSSRLGNEPYPAHIEMCVPSTNPNCVDIDNLTEVVLLMRIEARSVGQGGINWLGSCTTAPPTP